MPIDQIGDNIIKEEETEEEYDEEDLDELSSLNQDEMQSSQDDCINHSL